MATIVILDDDPDRILRMSELLRVQCADIALVTFDNAPDIIDWLRENVADASLICLDHDNGPNRLRSGKSFDPGAGRHVADFLALRTPVCPVIIHTTNSLAAPGMQMSLEDSGWQFSRVVPFNDLEWISAEWIQEVYRVMKSVE